MEEKMMKLKEYLHLENDISFEEFKEYYSGLITSLNADYAQMNQGACLKARYICSIVKANAENRSRNKANGKAFKKMAAKCSFWMEAIDYRLNKEGLPQSAIDLAMTEMNKQMEL